MKKIWIFTLILMTSAAVWAQDDIQPADSTATAAETDSTLVTQREFSAAKQISNATKAEGDLQRPSRFTKACCNRENPLRYIITWEIAIIKLTILHGPF